jgi:hypothetical protein
MKLTSQNLQEILDVAKASIRDGEDSFYYSINGYHFFVYCDYCIDGRDVWTIEPNILVDDCAEPIGSSEFVYYCDYAQLLIACEYLAERYFKED